MKRIYISILCAFCFTIINAEDIEIECDNFVSSQVNESVVDAPIVRPLNGGSVIVPSFSYSCPNEITVYSIFGEKMYSGKASDYFEIIDLNYDYVFTQSSNGVPETKGTLSLKVSLLQPAYYVSLDISRFHYQQTGNSIFFQNRFGHDVEVDENIISYSIENIRWGTYFSVMVYYYDENDERQYVVSDIYDTTDLLSEEHKQIVSDYAGVTSVETSENSIIYANNYLTVESENNGKISFYDYSGIEFKTVNFEANTPIFIDESFPKFFIAVATLDNGEVFTKKILK